MLNPEDYKEPACPFCADFYNPGSEKQTGSIPVPVIIEKLDFFFGKEDYTNAKKLLEYWIDEARLLYDRKGELSMLSEMMGLARRMNDKNTGLESVKRGFALIEAENLQQSVSAATIWINGATTMKAFGKAKESLRYYEKALAVYKKSLNPEDERFGGLYNNYALACADTGLTEKAMSLYKKALDIMSTKKYGAAEMAITYLNMADLLDSDDEETEMFLQKAYEMLNDPSLPQDGYYAFICRKCAPVFDYYGHFAIKNELNKKADDIYERS